MEATESKEYTGSRIILRAIYTSLPMMFFKLSLFIGFCLMGMTNIKMLLCFGLVSIILGYYVRKKHLSHFNIPLDSLISKTPNKSASTKKALFIGGAIGLGFYFIYSYYPHDRIFELFDSVKFAFFESYLLISVGFIIEISAFFLIVTKSSTEEGGISRYYVALLIFGGMFTSYAAYEILLSSLIPVPEFPFGMLGLLLISVTTSQIFLALVPGQISTKLVNICGLLSICLIWIIPWAILSYYINMSMIYVNLFVLGCYHLFRQVTSKKKILAWKIQLLGVPFILLSLMFAYFDKPFNVQIVRKNYEFAKRMTNPLIHPYLGKESNLADLP